jgi:hypothetical protein
VSIIEGAGKKGVNKKEILEQLVELFPDRSEKSMGTPIQVQVPGRISKEKWPVKWLEGGRFAKA